MTGNLGTCQYMAPGTRTSMGRTFASYPLASAFRIVVAVAGVLLDWLS
jgi:hypothetical protein